MHDRWWPGSFVVSLVFATLCWSADDSTRTRVLTDLTKLRYAPEASALDSGPWYKGTLARIAADIRPHAGDPKVLEAAWEVKQQCCWEEPEMAYEMKKDRIAGHWRETALLVEYLRLRRKEENVPPVKT